MIYAKTISASDSELDMYADISRRDFPSGVGITLGASLRPAESMSAPGVQNVPGDYPPALQGMRGSHPGSFASAHLARDAEISVIEEAHRELHQLT